MAQGIESGPLLFVSKSSFLGNEQWPPLLKEAFSCTVLKSGASFAKQDIVKSEFAKVAR